MLNLRVGQLTINRTTNHQQI